ncbi:CHAT domain-containing protein [Dictyobacter aurantiacus]|uniref:CHAT domain-containing protein n=1 Tax=Dictyobacter aurantiacus TaxID=1936993 RepID=UPI00135798C1|nr:CHAT domain-containing protein [Dictyobacter aurantiacus]
MGNNDIVKILFLAASPKETKRLQLDLENRTIKEFIHRSTYRENFKIENEWAVEDDNLLYFMNYHHPNIVHFSGHGTSTGEFILEGENRSIRPVPGEALQSLMQRFKDDVRLVILNACNSSIQAEMIAKEIDFVIGMDAPIGDKAAISFISAFYQALGFGNSIQNSFEQGLTQLQIKDIPAEYIPHLFTRPGVNASTTTWRELLFSNRKDRPISIFISYAPEDDKFRQELEKQFSVLRRNKTITITTVKSTLRGEVSEDKLVEYLNAADIVLLLISPDFLASDSLYNNELTPAIHRRQQGLTWVIPVLVRETAEWQNDELFGKLAELPANHKPVSAWRDQDSALVSIVQGVRDVIKAIKDQRSS